MKVLKGELKGRNLLVPEQIRPAAVRVKKSCFDILHEDIAGARVLDLFAGSGNLGIEALSGGAGQVVFVDSSKGCVEIIKKNLFSFKLTDKTEIYLKDAFSAVKDFFSRKEKFDFIFLDPPYYKGILIKILQTLEEYDILSPLGGVICLCYTKDEFLKQSERFPLILDRKYGQTRLLIYRKN